MDDKKVAFQTIDEYIVQFPVDIQQKLQSLRAVIKATAAEATERISYQMPTFYLHGNLVHFAAFKNHIGLYPGASGIEAFKHKMTGYKTSKGAVQFPINDPLPFELIQEIVHFRVAENINKSGERSKTNAPAPARCAWAPVNDALYIEYHDKEWGRPVHDDRKLFEMLILEGMQAGLSWITVLRKRDNFREAFDQFDVRKVVKYDEEKIEQLMNNPGIIRNRAKINATIANANAFIEVQEEYGSFDAFLWGYVGGTPIVNHWKESKEVPAKTELSDTISKDMKKRGFKFVGSTIVYAYLQAVGVVNDHIADCFLCDENLASSTQK